MEKALRVISVERGYDPRDFALICYGGAGGLHAADLARALGLQAVIIPQNPGAFSALGILLSDVVRDVAQSVLLPVPAVERDLIRQIERRYQQLQRQASSELRCEGFDAGRARAFRRLDVRYQGQSYELSVPFGASFREEFHREHTKAYGYAYPERPLEIVNLRLQLLIPTPKSKQRVLKSVPARPAREALVKTKPVWFNGRPQASGIYDRERLAHGARLRGPAVITEYSATTVVPPDFACKVDEHRNLILARRP
jgi:N-methylhydantoinase A